jgi:hypothetical protein
VADTVQFKWPVSAKGYKWVRGRRVDEPRGPVLPALIEAVSADRLSSLIPYPHPALFLELAITEPNEDGVLEFANRYGLLGLDETFLPTTPRGRTAPQITRGEFLDSWRGHMFAMRWLTWVWEMIRGEDRAALARHIKWDGLSRGEMTVYFNCHPDPHGDAPSLGFLPPKRMIATLDSDPQLLRRLTQSDVLQSANHYLLLELDDQLRTWAKDVEIGMFTDSRRPHPFVGYRCSTLAAAVWMQFSAAVGDDRSFGRCKECGKWFEFAPGIARSHRQYCSNRCRTRAFRERQVRARRMYTAGLSFEVIAAELESDITTVKQWITGSRE